MITYCAALPLSLSITCTPFSHRYHRSLSYHKLGYIHYIRIRMREKKWMICFNCFVCANNNQHANLKQRRIKYSQLLNRLFMMRRCEFGWHLFFVFLFAYARAEIYWYWEWTCFVTIELWTPHRIVVQSSIVWSILVNVMKCECNVKNPHTFGSESRNCDIAICGRYARIKVSWQKVTFVVYKTLCSIDCGLAMDSY